MLDLARDCIHYSLLVFESWSVDLQGSDASYIPAKTKINLLELPILQEDGTPKTCRQGIEERVLGQEKPSEQTGNGREEQEDQVRLQEGEVESNLAKSDQFWLFP